MASHPIWATGGWLATTFLNIDATPMGRLGVAKATPMAIGGGSATPKGNEGGFGQNNGFGPWGWPIYPRGPLGVASTTPNQPQGVAKWPPPGQMVALGGSLATLRAKSFFFFFF